VEQNSLSRKFLIAYEGEILQSDTFENLTLKNV